MFRSASLFIGTTFTVAVFTIFATSNVDSIVGIPHKIYSYANNFDPHKKPISLLNVPICTQDMQRTWWPEASTNIVTGPYCGAWFSSHRVDPHCLHKLLPREHQRDYVGLLKTREKMCWMLASISVVLYLGTQSGMCQDWFSYGLSPKQSPGYSPKWWWHRSLTSH